MEKSTFTGLSLLDGKSRPMPGEGVDFVVVNGLNGHPHMSWRVETSEQTESTWLENLLPPFVLNSRVMLYHYECSGIDKNPFLSANGLRQAAEALLTALNIKRQNGSKNRTLTFISHDLGGAIIKEALIIASRDRNFSSIANNTHQLVFFGTPHRVRDIESWDDQVRNIIFATSASSIYVRHLSSRVKAFSKALAQTSRDFKSIITRESVVNVYQQECDIHDGSENAVVDYYSATTDLIYETNIGRKAIHEDLGRLSKTDSELALVLKSLQREAYQAYTGCLSILGTLAPSFSIPGGVKQDLRHFQKHQEVETWLKSDSSSIAYLYCDQGVDKGVVSGDLFRSIQHQMPKGGHTTYYSFRLEDKRQTTRKSILSSLVYQLLIQDPSRFRQVRHLFLAINKYSSWTSNAVWVLFQSLITTLGSGTFYCVINEIHNCDTSRVRLLRDLSTLIANKGKLTRFKIILIGKERQDIKTTLNPISTVHLNGLVCSPESLMAYRTSITAKLIEERPYLLQFRQHLDDELKKCRSFLQLSMSFDNFMKRSHGLPSNCNSIEIELHKLPYEVSGLISEIFQALPKWARKALGWVLNAQRPMKIKELAVAIALYEGEGSIEVDKNELLLDLPTDLESAFGVTLRAENNEVSFGHEQVRQCFQELAKDEELNLGTEKARQSPAGRQQQAPIMSHWDIMRILIKFLCSNDIIAVTKKALGEDNWETPQGTVFELMDYAVRFWPTHYIQAEKQGYHVKDMYHILHHRDLVRIWLGLSSTLGIAHGPPNLCIVDPFSLAAYLGFTDIVALYLKKETENSIPLEIRSLAVSFASWAGHLDVVRMLVDDGLVDIPGMLLALDYASRQGFEDIVEFLLTKLVSPTQSVVWDPAVLCQAAELGYDEIVSKLLIAGADLNYAYEGGTPLQLASKNGHKSVVFKLLSWKADPNTRTANGLSEALQSPAVEDYSVVDVCAFNDDKHTALRFASQYGHYEIVGLLLGLHPPILTQDSEGRTALHLAALNGHAEVIKLLTQDELDPGIDLQDSLGNTPLKLASIHGHQPAVKLLLQKRAKVELTDSTEIGVPGHTALYAATFNGHEEIAEMILKETPTETAIEDIISVLILAAEKGFFSICKQCIPRISRHDLNTVDAVSYTALHYAAREGHLAIVLLLVYHGATIDLVNVDRNTNKAYTPLALAAIAGREQVVKALLARKANYSFQINKTNLVSHVAKIPGDKGNHADTIELLLRAGVDPNGVDHERRSALHHAARSGNVKIVRVLFRHNASSQLQDKLLWTPLYHAVRGGNKDIVRLFIDQRADLLIKDDDGWTPMHVAAMYGHVPVMEMLWEEAPDLLNRRSQDGSTLLHFAFSKPASVRWLLAHSVDIDAQTKSGKTTLMASAERGCSEVVELLLSHNANLSLRDNSQKTALHYAACRGQIQIALKLMERDINVVTNQDDHGYTALHMAILEGQSRFVDTILERSPHLSINLKDKDGNTPLLLAVQKNVDVVIESLLRCEANAELRNKKGETALTKAVTKAVAFSIRRKVESAWTTLLKTPDRLNINAGGGAFPTALHIATRSGELGVLKQLVMEYGADVNAQGGLYNTALQAAAVSGYDDLVEFLLENGADASISGGLFANALSAAIWFGDFAIVPMLYEKGADVNARDEQGRTAVHISAWRGSVENIEWLMARSGDLSLKDYQGRTVLHHAAMGGTLEMVEMIMQDRRLELSNLEDVDGWTALHWACRSAKNGNVIRFLVEAGADSSKKAKHGWTPENIAIFHNASDLLPLLSANELAGGKMSNETEHGGISRSTELPKKDKWRVSEIAYGYVCDGCQQHPIYGRRWKCLVCEDFNFCFKCYWGKGITHAEHAFEGNGADSGTVLELVSDSN